jgi:hypothetical protein
MVLKNSMQLLPGRGAGYGDQQESKKNNNSFHGQFNRFSVFIKPVMYGGIRESQKMWAFRQFCHFLSPIKPFKPNLFIGIIRQGTDFRLPKSHKNIMKLSNYNKRANLLAVVEKTSEVFPSLKIWALSDFGSLTKRC